MTSFYDSLGETERARLASPLRDRIAITTHEEWRLFWQARLQLVLYGTDRGIGEFEALTSATDAEVRAAAFMMLGELHQDTGRLEEALRMYEAAARSVASAHATYRIAACHVRLGDAAEGERLLRAALLAGEGASDCDWMRSAVRDYLALARKSSEGPDPAVIDHVHRVCRTA